MSNNNSVNVHMSPNNLVVACICTSDYLWQYELLAKSIRRWSDFRIVLCIPDMDSMCNAFDDVADYVVSLSEIAGNDCTLLHRLYSGIELCCVLKPYIIQHVIDRFGYCLYIDNDVCFYSSITSLCDQFRFGDVVLFPHRLSMKNYDNRNLSINTEVLKTGYFNAGMLMASTGGWDALERWKESIKLSCVIDVDNGLYVDQVWLCSMFGSESKIHICTDAGHNIAYWNFDERLTVVTFPGSDLTNVKSIHYSGFNSEMLTLKRASKYSNVSIPDRLLPLFIDYDNQRRLNIPATVIHPRLAEFSSEIRNRYRLGILTSGLLLTRDILGITDIEAGATSEALNDYLLKTRQNVVLLLTRKTLWCLLQAIFTKVIRKLLRIN